MLNAQSRLECKNKINNSINKISEQFRNLCPHMTTNLFLFILHLAHSIEFCTNIFLWTQTHFETKSQPLDTCDSWKVKASIGFKIARGDTGGYRNSKNTLDL